MKEIAHIMLTIERMKEKMGHNVPMNKNFAADIEQIEKQIDLLGEKFNKRTQPSRFSCVCYCILGAAITIMMFAIFRPFNF